MWDYVIYFALVSAGALTFLAMRRWPGLRLAGAVALAAIGASVAALLAIASEPEHFLSDFEKAYYEAGQLVQEDPSALYDRDPLGFVNIPIVAYAFTPFTWLPEGAAGLLFTAMGLAALAGAFVMLVRLGRFDGWGVLLLGGLFVINGPLYNSMREGNATHFVLFGIVLMLTLAYMRHSALAGVALALCVAKKPPLGHLMLAFAVRGNWRYVVAFFSVLATLGALSLIIFDIEPHTNWYTNVVQPLQGHPLGAFNVQSTDGFLVRLYEGDSYMLDWEPIDGMPASFWVIRSIMLLAFPAAVVAVWLYGRPAEGEDTLLHDVCIMICLSLIIGPVTWSHYYAQLLIPVALIIGGRIALPDGLAWRAWLGAIVLLVSAPVFGAVPGDAMLAELVSHVLHSHFYIGAVLMLALLLTLRVRYAAVARAGVREPAMRGAIPNTAPGRSVYEQLLPG